MLSLICEMADGIKIPCNNCKYREDCYEVDRALNNLWKDIRRQRGNGVSLRLRDFSLLKEVERREELR